MKLRPAKPISVALIAAAGLILSCAVLALVLVLASRPDPQKTPSSALRNPLDGIENGVSSLFRGDFSGDEYFAANYFPTLLGAKGDGVANDTKALRKSLEQAAQTGGTVYLPQGIYRITEPLTIPSNVTLRGDFSSPNSKGSDGGKTILWVADNESLRSAPLITLESNSSLMGITVYYEAQRPDTILEYPSTLFCNGTVTVQNVALLNPYHGICVTGSGVAQIRSVWMSPLDYGILVTDNNDRVVVEDCSISPTYWLNYAPDVFADGKGYPTLTSYLQEHLHGILLEQVTDVTLNRIFVEDGAVGILLNVPYERKGVLLVKETNLASVVRPLYLQSLPTSGVLISDSAFRPQNDTGADTVYLGADAKAPVIFANCTFAGLPKRVIKGENHSFVSFYHCNFGTWWDVCFDMSADTFLAVNPTFKSQNEKALLGKDAFGLLYNAQSIEESSQLLFSVPVGEAIQTKSESVTSLKDTTLPFVNAPVLNAADYGISPDADDNAPQMKLLLKEAEEQKATVFLPEGIYRFRSAIQIPASVRLIGVGCSGTYSTVLNFELDQSPAKALLALGTGASLENLEVRSGSIPSASEIYALSSNKNEIRIRNVTVSAGWAISLVGCQNATLEQVTLNATQVGISVQSTKQLHLRKITISDPSGSYGTVGIRLNNTEGTLLSEFRGIKLALNLDLQGSSDLTATLMTLKAASVGIQANHSAAVLITASGFSESGQGGQTTFLQGGADLSGSVTVQGLVSSGSSLPGTLVSAQKGTVEVRAALITTPFNETVRCEGEANIALYGCIWDVKPTAHALANGGTVTFGANIIRSDKLFEGIEGDYMLVTSTGETAGTVKDDVNIIQHIYEEIQTEVKPEEELQTN